MGDSWPSQRDERTLRLWDVSTGKEVRTLPRLDGPIDWVRFSPDGHCLACVDDSRKAIHLWKVKTGEKVLIRTRTKIYPVPMRFSTNGKILVSISEDENKVLYAWDTSSGKELWRVPDVSGSFCFALSPDGNLLADVEEQTIVFRDLRTGKLLRRCVTPLTWNVYSMWRLAFSPDGRYLVAHGWSCAAYVGDGDGPRAGGCAGPSGAAANDRLLGGRSAHRRHGRRSRPCLGGGHQQSRANLPRERGT